MLLDMLPDAPGCPIVLLPVIGVAAGVAGAVVVVVPCAKADDAASKAAAAITGRRICIVIPLS